MKTFDDFFEWLMQWEGETFENDPDDPGGATKFGIDQRSHPGLNIRQLTREQAKKIYLAEYHMSNASKLPYPLNFVQFDAVVNCGESRATKCLQSALRLKVDGVFGPVTRAAFEAVSPTNFTPFARSLISHREGFYYRLGQGRMRKFLRGWLNRTRSLREFLF